jgi:hypothetical protein
MPVKHSYLAAGAVLQPGDYLVSPNGKYVASLKENGQLGLCYTVQGSSEPDWKRCYWQSPASPGNKPWGVMQDDGNFVLYDGPQPMDPDHPDPAYFASSTPLYRPFVTTLLDDGNLVVCTGVPPGDPEEIVWSALPQISAGCKFMQNYRVTVPVNGGPNILAIRNKAGGIELFTIGSAGDIHTFWPDPTSETGYSQATLTSGMKLSQLAGGADTAGNVVLFASSGSVVYALAETSDPANRWGTPLALAMPYPSGPATEIVARNVGGELWLLAVMKTGGTLYQPAAMRWGTDNKLRLNTGLSFQSSPPALIQLAGSPAEPTATFMTPDKITFWGFSSNRMDSAPLPGQPPLSLDISTDHAGASWIVAVLQDLQVCRLAAANNTYAWNPLWPAIPSVQFQEVVAEADASGGVHVFAVTKPPAPVSGAPAANNVLYHLAPGEPAGTQPVPVYASSGMQLAGVANDADGIDLYAVSAGNLVTHLFAEVGEDGTNWVEQRVLDPADDTLPITEYSSYATDITLYDGDQSVLAFEPVNIYAADRTRIEINGLTFFIDENRPAPVTSDAAGMLRISQETDSLASPLLRVKLSTTRMPDTAPIIVVEPYADVQAALADQTGEKLLAVKVTNDDGTQSDLLQGTYRDDTTADSLAQALENFMGATANKGELDEVQSARLAARAQVHMAGARPAANGSRPSVAERSRFWSRQEPHPGGLRHAGELRPGRPARLTFPDGGFGYEPLTAAQAAEHARQIAALPDVSATGFLSWISSIGDAFRAVANGIAKVAQVVWDGINAAFELVVEGVSYAFNAVVKFIEDAFDMVEMIFNHVKVFFETLYKWLAWLFDWTSINQAKICISTAFGAMMEFLEGAVTHLRLNVDAGFAAFKDQFAEMMDEAIKAVGSYSIGGYTQRNTPYSADAAAATSNNFFFNEFVARGLSSGPTVSVASSDALTTLANLVDGLAQAEEDSAETFSQALSYFTNLGSQPDQIFSDLLSGMLTVLKGIGMVALDLANALLDALLDAVSDVIHAFIQAVTQKISIPFLSTFYKWITKGDDLTVLNVVSLATAIPAAILYKITTGDPMFTADSGPGSSDDVTGIFNSTLMLQAAGLAAASPRASSSPLPPTTEKTARILSGFYLATTLMSGMLSGAADVFENPAEAGGNLAYGGLAYSLVAAVFSFPWFYADTGSLSIEGDIYMALCYSLVGVAFLYTIFAKLPTPGANDIIAIAMTVAGVFLIAQAAWGARNHPDPRVIAWMIIQRIPWAAKFLKVTAVRAAASWSMFALGWLDFVAGGLVTGLLGFFVLRERYDIPDLLLEAGPSLEANPA